MKRLGVVGIVVTDKSVTPKLQEVLSEFSDVIVGRMGVPRKNVSAISLIVEGEVERISALTGRLGKFENINVKSALTSHIIEE